MGLIKNIFTRKHKKSRKSSRRKSSYRARRRSKCKRYSPKYKCGSKKPRGRKGGWSKGSKEYKRLKALRKKYHLGEYKNK